MDPRGGTISFLILMPEAAFFLAEQIGYFLFQKLRVFQEPDLDLKFFMYSIHIRQFRKGPGRSGFVILI